MIGKRTRAIVATILLISGLYFFPQYWWASIGASLICVYWFLDFDLRFPEVFPFLYLPLIFGGVLSFGQSGIQEEWLRIAVFVLGGVGYYVLLLALNIVNVSTIRTVPLKRAAHSTLYSLGLMLFFAAGLRLANQGWGAHLYVLSYWGALALFAVSYFKLVLSRYYWVEVAVFAFIAGQVILLVNFWPSEQWVSVAAVVGWCFIYLGLIQHVIDKSLNRSILREYGIFGLLLFLALLLI